MKEQPTISMLLLCPRLYFAHLCRDTNRIVSVPSSTNIKLVGREVPLIGQVDVAIRAETLTRWEARCGPSAHSCYCCCFQFVDEHDQKWRDGRRCCYSDRIDNLLMAFLSSRLNGLMYLCPALIIALSVVMNVFLLGCLLWRWVWHFWSRRGELFQSSQHRIYPVQLRNDFSYSAQSHVLKASATNNNPFRYRLILASYNF